MGVPTEESIYEVPKMVREAGGAVIVDGPVLMASVVEEKDLVVVEAGETWAMRTNVVEAQRINYILKRALRTNASSPGVVELLDRAPLLSGDDFLAVSVDLGASSLAVGGVGGRREALTSLLPFILNCPENCPARPITASAATQSDAPPASWRDHWLAILIFGESCTLLNC